MSKKSTVLAREDTTAYVSAKNVFLAAKSKIVNRIDAVISLICIACDKPRGRGYWYFAGAEEGEVGNLEMPVGDEDRISYVFQDGPNLPSPVSDYDCGFPKKFLFMDDDEIIVSIQKDISHQERLDLEAKTKAQEAKSKRLLKKQEVLAKISEKDKKILGL